MLKQIVSIGETSGLFGKKGICYTFSVDSVFRICQAHACLFGVLFLLRQSEGKLYSHLLKLFSLTSENPMNKGF